MTDTLHSKQIQDIPEEVLKRARAGLEAFRKESEYFRVHYDDLLEKYNGKWVGILNQELVGVGANMEELLDELKRKGKPLRQVFIEYMTDEEPVKEFLWIPSS